MLTIGALGTDALRARCRGAGLRFRMGEFSVCLHTRIDAVLVGVALLYADFALLDEAAFIDFPVTVERVPHPRRWLRAQVQFRCDGHAPFLPLPLAQAFPLLEWGLNWCVSAHVHSHLVIHAAVLEKHGRATILPAPPGSGKSTLCAALMLRGWRLLSDELTLIRLSDGHIVPLPRPVSLKNGSIGVIARFQANAVLSRPVTDTVKGTVAHLKPARASVESAALACRAATIVFPLYQAGARTSMAPLAQARAFMRVADNAFNYSVLGERGFDVLANVVDGARCYAFTYSVLEQAVVEFDALHARPS